MDFQGEEMNLNRTEAESVLRALDFVLVETMSLDQMDVIFRDRFKKIIETTPTLRVQRLYQQIQSAIKNGDDV